MGSTSKRPYSMRGPPVGGTALSCSEQVPSMFGDRAYVEENTGGPAILQPRSAIGADASRLAIYVRLLPVVREAQQRTDVGREK